MPLLTIFYCAAEDTVASSNTKLESEAKARHAIVDCIFQSNPDLKSFSYAASELGLDRASPEFNISTFDVFKTVRQAADGSADGGELGAAAEYGLHFRGNGPNTFTFGNWNFNMWKASDESLMEVTASMGMTNTNPVKQTRNATLDYLAGLEIAGVLLMNHGSMAVKVYSPIMPPTAECQLVSRALTRVGVNTAEQLTIATQLFELAHKSKQVHEVTALLLSQELDIPSSQVLSQVLSQARLYFQGLDALDIPTSKGNDTCMRMNLSSVINFATEVRSILPTGTLSRLDQEAEVRHSVIDCIFSVDSNLKSFAFSASQLGLDISAPLLGGQSVSYDQSEWRESGGVASYYSARGSGVITLLSDEDVTRIQHQVAEHGVDSIILETDVDFGVDRNNSNHPSYIKYLDLMTNTIKEWSGLGTGNTKWLSIYGVTNPATAPVVPTMAPTYAPTATPTFALGMSQSMFAKALVVFTSYLVLLQVYTSKAIWEFMLVQRGVNRSMMWPRVQQLQLNLGTQ